MHVMDIAQNAVAAGAANTHIILRMDTATDRLELTMEDDGCLLYTSDAADD